MVKIKHTQGNAILTLQPNRSANWQQSKKLIWAMSLFVMVIAIAWSFVGAWYVLPFAGLEVGLLVFLIYRVSYSTYQKQIIYIKDKQIVFQSGVYSPKQHTIFNRDDTQLVINEAETEFEHTQIKLSDKCQNIEIGQFLNQKDRKIALQHFKKAGVFIQNKKWWLAP